MNERRSKQLESVVHYHLSNYFLKNRDLYKENIIISYIESNQKGTAIKVWITYDNFVFKDGNNENSYKYLLLKINRNIKDINAYLFQHLNIRNVPQISFKFDLSGYRVDRLNDILKKIKNK